MRCVPAHDFNVAKALAWRSAIADDPPYQRESSIWSREKQQLFVDSLLNGYDVPKIYLHDLRGRHPTRVYAVVDGKQRLSTIWSFLSDEFPLADDFRIEPNNLPELPPGVDHPRAGQRFSELDPAWQRVLRSTHLAVVLIQNARPEDIEDLFARLNNGEPLTAAEKRNAMSGDATRMIRQLARHPFFGSRLRFSNARYHHLDAAARFLVIEAARDRRTERTPDLRSRDLDAFVRAHRRIDPHRRRSLRTRIHSTLARMCEIFTEHDPLLASVAAPQLYYLVAARLADGQPAGWASSVRDVLVAFQPDRHAGPAAGGPSGAPAAPNAGRSLDRRAEAILDRLRSAHPEVAILEPDSGRRDAPVHSDRGT